MDAADAQVLITARFSLDVTDVRLIGAGWDYDAFLARDSRGREWVFRFPQRGEVVPRLQREAAWLPHVAEALRGVTRVPEFEFMAAEGKWFPHPFVGYRLLPGRPLFDVRGARIPPPGAARTLGAELAEVFRRLHAIDLETVPGADFPGEVGTPRTWFDEMHAARDGILGALPAALAADCRGWLEHLTPPPAYDGPPCLVHDDLGSVHVLVDERLRLTGGIDFGDIDAGDPAVDVAYVTNWLGRDGTQALLAAYGASEAFAERVRTTGVLLAMSWILECLEITRETPQDFHFQWLDTALTVAA